MFQAFFPPSYKRKREGLITVYNPPGCRNYFSLSKTDSSLLVAFSESQRSDHSVVDVVGSEPRPSRLSESSSSSGSGTSSSSDSSSSSGSSSSASSSDSESGSEE